MPEKASGKQKWTPGPWRTAPRLSGSENHKGWNLSAGSEGTDWKWLGEISPMNNADGDPSAEGKANALLISKAPELVEALREQNWALCEVLDSLGALLSPHELDGHGITSEDRARIYASLAKAQALLEEVERG